MTNEDTMTSTATEAQFAVNTANHNLAVTALRLAVSFYDSSSPEQEEMTRILAMAINELEEKATEYGKLKAMSKDMEKEYMATY